MFLFLFSLSNLYFYNELVISNIPAFIDTTTTDIVQTSDSQTLTQLPEGLSIFNFIKHQKINEYICIEQSTSTEQQSSIITSTELIPSTTSIPLTVVTSSTKITTISTILSNQSNNWVRLRIVWKSIFDLGCFSPVITLIPSTSSLSSPLQFRRNQDFYLSSYLQLNCNNSLSTITKWTINNCTSNCSFQIQMGQIIITTSSELFIPAETLNYGTYQLTLTVTMIAAPHLISSASAYMKITPSNITANLVQFGTSMITRGYQQDLLLDPGTFSVDPDTTTFNASVSFSRIVKSYFSCCSFYSIELEI